MTKARNSARWNEQVPMSGARKDSSDEAFTELARTHSPRIYNLSLRFFRNSADAEDNVQNALCKAYAKFHQFEGRSRFSTWLTRIVINEALMTIRSRRSENVTTEADMATSRSEDVTNLDVEDRNANQERRYIAKELAAKALGQVSPVAADLFFRHVAEGWTQKELAHKEGISPAAMKSRIFSARSRMVHQLHQII